MLTPLASLWLPILLSTVAVFVLSFMMWMVFPHHKSDWKASPDEDGLMDALRAKGHTSRQYSFPHCSSGEEMKDPAFIEKYNRGPKGFLILFPEGKLNIPKSMLVSTVFNAIVISLVAYVAGMVIAPGAEGSHVLRLVATVAFLGFSTALGWGPIWFARTWSSTLKEMIDGLIYGLATGAIFMALWPAIETAVQ